ncbi:MAG: DUF6503 family protein [Saprospiraceae bacterium]
MRFKLILYSFSFFIIITACNKQEKTTDTKNMPMPVPAEKTEAQRIVDQVIEKHGGKAIANSIIKFTFRDRQYKATRRGESFEYERAWTDSTGQQIRDVMNNGGMYREINGKRMEISKEDQSKYSNSINSVIYFALLPYFLNDRAVIKEYLGEVNIKGKAYHKIKVTFQQEGGGKDHEDEYVYWFNRDSLTMDYLAYNYLTDGGGARFREAYNVQYVNGVRFADYTNFKPKDATNRDVITFDDLFTNGNLEELSKIENQNIEVIILKN